MLDLEELMILIINCVIKEIWEPLRITKDENVHRFALSAIRGELLERDSFVKLYTGYLLSID